MKIAINPGHSGSDPGAIGRETGIYEANIAWAVSVATAALLKGKGHEVHFTRTQEQRFPSAPFCLQRAVARANVLDVDIFVSIHCNSVLSRDPEGFEIWHYEGSKKGKELAGRILAELSSRVERPSRGLKESRGLYVLRKTIMPAVLVELDFLSNPDGEAFLFEGSSQIQYAQAIAEAFS